MSSETEKKNIVKDTYSKIARNAEARHDIVSACCTGSFGEVSCCDPAGGVTFADSYKQLDGYNPDADLALGCGLPTESSGITTGHTVLDLGSGAGNDVFVARSLVGDTGRVIGLDMVPDMIAKAEENAQRLGHENVEFILGEIEEMPLPDNSVDVVISNCVLNLVPNKATAFAEINRVLRPGGHFSISDVVLEGELPPALAEAAVVYAGCVAGAMQKNDYLETIAQAGFEDIVIHKEKPIVLPDSLLTDILGKDGVEELKRSQVGIFSITVSGKIG